MSLTRSAVSSIMSANLQRSLHSPEAHHITQRITFHQEILDISVMSFTEASPQSKQFCPITFASTKWAEVGNNTTSQSQKKLLIPAGPEFPTVLQSKFSLKKPSGVGAPTDNYGRLNSMGESNLLPNSLNWYMRKSQNYQD